MVNKAQPHLLDMREKPLEKNILHVKHELESSGLIYKLLHRNHPKFDQRQNSFLARIMHQHLLCREI